MVTIYKNGAKQEEVALNPIQTKQELHALFQSRGFQKKSPEELEADKKRKDSSDKEDIAVTREQQYQRDKIYRPSTRKAGLMTDQELREKFEREFSGRTTSRSTFPSHFTILGLSGAAAIAVLSTIAYTRSRLGRGQHQHRS